MLNNQYILYVDVDVSFILYADNRCAKGLGQGISLYLANTNNRILSTNRILYECIGSQYVAGGFTPQIRRSGLEFHITCKPIK